MRTIARAFTGRLTDGAGAPLGAVRGHLQVIRGARTVRYAGDFRGGDGAPGVPAPRGEHGPEMTDGSVLRVMIEDSERGSSRFLSEAVLSGDVPQS